MKTVPPCVGVRPQPRHKFGGFTLIELLTVIAIIGILAAIIIPTVTKVRSTARKVQCVSNLRQWGTAVRLFANENKGMVALYNKSGTDQLLYSKYFGQLYMNDAHGNRVMAQVAMAQCPVTAASNLAPSDPNYRVRDFAFVKPRGASKRVTAASLGVPPASDGGNIDVYNLSDALNPSRLILMAEVFSPSNDHLVIDCSTGAAPLQSPVQAMQINPNAGLIRHGGIANMLWLDGHVSSVTATQTSFSNPAARTEMTTWVTLK